MRIFRRLLYSVDGFHVNHPFGYVSIIPFSDRAWRQLGFEPLKWVDELPLLPTYADSNVRAFAAADHGAHESGDWQFPESKGALIADVCKVSKQKRGSQLHMSSVLAVAVTHAGVSCVIRLWGMSFHTSCNGCTRPKRVTKVPEQDLLLCRCLLLA